MRFLGMYPIYGDLFHYPFAIVDIPLERVGQRMSIGLLDSFDNDCSACLSCTGLPANEFIACEGHFAFYARIGALSGTRSFKFIVTSTECRKPLARSAYFKVRRRLRAGENLDHDTVVATVSSRRRKSAAGPSSNANAAALQHVPMSTQTASASQPLDPIESVLHCDEMLDAPNTDYIDLNFWSEENIALLEMQHATLEQELGQLWNRMHPMVHRLAELEFALSIAKQMTEPVESA